MSVITGEVFKSKIPLTRKKIKTWCIKGGRQKIADKITTEPGFNQHELSAVIAIHLTPEGRAGQTELVTFGSPLTLPFKAKKAWPTANEELELIISVTDLKLITWPRGKTCSPWLDSEVTKVNFR